MKAKEYYTISDIVRKLGASPGHFITVQRGLKELFGDKYKDRYVPREDIDEVIHLLKKHWPSQSKFGRIERAKVHPWYQD